MKIQIGFDIFARYTVVLELAKCFYDQEKEIRFWWKKELSKLVNK